MCQGHSYQVCMVTWLIKQSKYCLTFFVTYMHESGVSFNQRNTPENAYHTCVTVEAFFS